MISAGERDRQIEIAPLEFVEDDAAAPEYLAAAWVPLWAKKVDVSVESNYDVRMRQAVGKVAFIVEYSESIELPLMVRYEGSLFDVLTLEELGFKEDIKLVCRMVGRTKPL